MMLRWIVSVRSRIGPVRGTLVALDYVGHEGEIHFQKCFSTILDERALILPPDQLYTGSGSTCCLTTPK